MEVADFKLYASMGGVIGLDFEVAERWIISQYGLDKEFMKDLMRRFRLIDRVLTDQYNQYLESKSKSGSSSAGSSGSIMSNK